MKFVLSIICLGILFSTCPQTHKFRLEVKLIFDRADTLSEISPAIPNGEEINVLQNDFSELEKNVLYAFYKNSRKVKISQSQILDQLARLGILYWNEDKFNERKKKRRLQKYVNRSLRHLNTGFGLIEMYSFSVDLVETKNKRYFYDKRGSAGGLNLYQGSKKDVKKPEDYDYIPLKEKTYEAIQKEIENRIRKLKISKNLSAGAFSYVGIEIKVDPKTLYKNKIPKARVVVFFGARRLQYLMPKEVLVQAEKDSF